MDLENNSAFPVGTPLLINLNKCVKGTSLLGNTYSSGTVWSFNASRTVNLRGSVGCKWTSLLP